MTADTVIARTYPDDTQTLYKTGVVVMYPDGVTEDQMLTTRVPNMSGMSAIECIEACIKLDLNCKVEGDVSGSCIAQSEDSGATVLAGDIIKVTLSSDPALQAQQGTSATDAAGSSDTVTDGNAGQNEDGIVTETTLPPDQGNGTTPEETTTSEP